MFYLLTHLNDLNDFYHHFLIVSELMWMQMTVIVCFIEAFQMGFTVREAAAAVSVAEDAALSTS